METEGKLIGSAGSIEPQVAPETEQMVTKMGRLLDTACRLSNRIKAVADDFEGEMPAELPTTAKGTEVPVTPESFLGRMGGLISDIEIAHSRAGEMLERLESKF